jgi:hypothetical protein
LLSRFSRIACACVSFSALGCGAAAAQSAPSPAPSGGTNDRAGGAPATVATPAPGWDPLGVKGLTISGTLRAYDFNRVNTPEYNAKGAATGPNRAAFNFGGDLRADYKIGTSPFSVGGAFWGAFPFGANGGTVGCNVGAGLIVNESAALCAKNNAGVDNSLPGYALETFEYYVKYSDPTASVTIGNQLLNKAWEPASDSRIKPSLYQGGDATINVTKALAIGLTRVTRFDNRSESLFDQCTLLTCNSGVTPAGIGSIVGRKSITTGADRLALTFKPSARVTVSAETYRFHNIANLTYFESKYYVLKKNVNNPYFGVQFVDERQSGSAILGRVQNQTVGLQLGVTPVRNLLFTVGADQAPWNYDVVSAASAAAATAPYFLAAGGTNALVAGGVNGAAVNAVKVAPGRYKVAYGGIASPYSDSYASDPLYTTSISQGMVDRRSAGFALKGALTFTTTDKRLVAIASEAAYNYDTAFTRNRTYEFDADLTYNFNPVRPGTYHGFSLRERFADRTQPTLPYNFKYIRHQLQYSF